MAKTFFEKKQNNVESLKEYKQREEDYCPSVESKLRKSLSNCFGVMGNQEAYFDGLSCFSSLEILPDDNKMKFYFQLNKKMMSESENLRMIYCVCMNQFTCIYLFFLMRRFICWRLYWKCVSAKACLAPVLLNMD